MAFALRQRAVNSRKNSSSEFVFLLTTAEKKLALDIVNRMR